MDIKEKKKKVRQSAIFVTFFALAVALSYKLYIRCVETSSPSSTEQFKPHDVDKSKFDAGLEFVPIARGSAEGGLHLLSALNDRDIGGTMQGNRTVTVFVLTEKQAEAVKVLNLLRRKDLWFIQEFKESLTE